MDEEKVIFAINLLMPQRSLTDLAQLNSNDLFEMIKIIETKKGNVLQELNDIQQKILFIEQYMIPHTTNPIKYNNTEFMGEKQYLARIALLLLFLAFDDPSFYWKVYTNNKDFHQNLNSVRLSCLNDQLFNFDNIIVFYQNNDSKYIDNSQIHHNVEHYIQCSNSEPGELNGHRGDVQQEENFNKTQTGNTFDNFYDPKIRHTTQAHNQDSIPIYINISDGKGGYLTDTLIVYTEKGTHTCQGCKDTEAPLSVRRIESEAACVIHLNQYYHPKCAKIGRVCEKLDLTNLSKTKANNLLKEFT